MQLSYYVQNIDSLEKQAGLSEEKLIQAHGSFTTASCTADNCTYTCRGVEVRLIIILLLLHENAAYCKPT